MPKQGTRSQTIQKTRSYVKADKTGRWFVISTAKSKDGAQVSGEWIQSTHTYTVKQ